MTGYAISGISGVSSISGSTPRLPKLDAPLPLPYNSAAYEAA